MKILNRYSGAVIWESPCSTMLETVESAIKARANLTDANLTDANLTDANLTRANLTDANLTRADLTRADLTDANLTRANLTRANLTDADLTRADLTDANLTRANLTDADLTAADLTDADLTAADLTDANLTAADLTRADLTAADLTIARADFLSEVLNLPNELEFLRDALIAGEVNGSSYSGKCACLAGTLAHAKGIQNYEGGEIKNGRTFKADSYSPRERFFLAIETGDTPETNGASKLALDWTNEAIAIRDNIRAAAAIA